MPMTKLQIKVYVDKKSTESETAAGKKTRQKWN